MVRPAKFIGLLVVVTINHVQSWVHIVVNVHQAYFSVIIYCRNVIIIVISCPCESRKCPTPRPNTGLPRYRDLDKLKKKMKNRNSTLTLFLPKISARKTPHFSRIIRALLVPEKMGIPCGTSKKQKQKQVECPPHRLPSHLIKNRV